MHILGSQAYIESVEGFKCSLHITWELGDVPQQLENATKKKEWSPKKIKTQQLTDRDLHAKFDCEDTEKQE